MDSENGLRSVRGTDEVVLGGGLTTCSPALLEVFGAVGLDFAFVDLEHAGFSPWDATELTALVRTAEAADVDLLVRLPSSDLEPGNHGPLVRKVLDAGVRNVLLPRVETATEVRNAVRAARYWYDGDVGDRGIGGGRSTRWGTTMDADTLEREDDSTLVGVMVENATAVENVEEILAVPELGFVCLGPMDLSHSLGHPTELDHASVREALATVESACVEAGVPLAGMLFDREAFGATVERGYQILTVGTDTGVVAEGFESRLTEFGTVLADRTGE